MWLVDLLFCIIFCVLRPTSGLTLELHTEDQGQCFDLKDTNFYDVANFTVVLDECETKLSVPQQISCHGKDTLKLQLFNDSECSNLNKSYIIKKGGCYSARSGERISTDAPTVSPTRSPVWDLLNFDTNCSNEDIESEMWNVIDININGGQWLHDCKYMSNMLKEAVENGTFFNDTHVTCSCLGPLSWDDAWRLLNCMVTFQFNGVQVWTVCNNKGYGIDDIYSRRINPDGYGSLLDVDWDQARRSLFHRLSAMNDFAVLNDGDWNLNRRLLNHFIGEDEYISLTWEDDTCSDTCACSEDYNNEFGYGYLDADGTCQCGMLQVLGLTCEMGLAGFPNTVIGNNPWSQRTTTFLINHCTRHLDSPYEGQYRKVTCINHNTELLFQFYNDDPTCTDEFATATIRELTCYNYSLLAEGSTDSPTPTPSDSPTRPPSTWPVLDYSYCGDDFETVLTEYIYDINPDIADECLTLANAIDQTEQTVACPCLSQIPEFFALQYMNCNISDTHQGLEVWGYCICIGYPDCVANGDCREECPYYPLCPGHDGFDDCPDIRRRKPEERRRVDFEETFMVLGISKQCGDFSPYPTLVPTTLRPSSSPSPMPSDSPTTPYPTTRSPTHAPTTPNPTPKPTTASPTISPSTPWPTTHPTSGGDDASAFGLIFLEMDKRDELLILAIMALTTFCLVFSLYKVLLERRLGLANVNCDSEGEEFIISDDHEHFHMTTEENRGSSLKYVSHD